MMFRLIASAMATAAMAFALSAESNITRYNLKVNDFSELKVVDDINVIYRSHPDSVGQVVFYASSDQASSLIFQPDGAKLDIQLSPEAARNSHGFPTVTVYSTYLTRAENDGKSHLIIESIASGPKFKCVLVGNGRLTAKNLNFTTVEASLMTGNGEIVVSGTTDLAKLSSTGTGQIQADELKAKEAKCRLVGTGSIGVNASESLTVSGMGSGTVYYIGNPTLKNRTLGVKTQQLGGKSSDAR